ncbi:Bug family tripartite tricarboxylate transporter substrate binding protein [Acidovorax radicis]|jgi:tripartite-type tricarboxylate transporter receptor subunit TctC|uniref:Bug family tripartite tricarboxylate transporter substrate binding protein n=1 Tax=Acidovorax radicis TaxID=758826 RepID=UPI001CF93F62|nr:tripartite tricarboxylate transporter substrate binding protein [Acidovorax radicis]UCU99687.1 tripartite tricarboxylate transporter substrate binding protein [Acidovorax radicis]
MQRKHFIRAVLRTAFGAATLAMAASGFAQSYPSKPVRVVIPFPPGGTLDTVGRMLAQKLGEQMGQNFIVENKPGGNGVIGGDTVAKAPADGYTLLFNASTFTTAPMTMKAVPYSVNKDFAPVALVAKAPLSVAINKKLPVTDIKSLLAYAKANPGKMTFAVGSIGSAGHLSTELLKRAGNLDYLIVPYKGTAPAFQDLIGGQIDGFIDPILGSLQYHKSGMLRVVAVTSAQRAASLPDVPTVAETIPGYEFYSWYGLWGPAKLPADITQRLNTEVNKALAEMGPKLKEQGLLTTPGSVEDFAKFQHSDMERSQKIVTEGNIRVE